MRARPPARSGSPPVDAPSRSRRTTSSPAASSRRKRLPMPISESSLFSSPLRSTSAIERDPGPRRQRPRVLDVTGELFALALHHVQYAPLPLEELALLAKERRVRRVRLVDERRCACICSPAGKSRRSRAIHVELQEVGRAGDAGVVVADRLLAAQLQLARRGVRRAAARTRAGPARSRLVLGGWRHDPAPPRSRRRPSSS